jgi:hypothetical protein
MPFKILTAVVGLTFLSEAISRYLAITIRNSNPPYHFFCCIEYLGFALIYANLLKQKSVRKMILFSIPIFILSSLFNTIFVQQLFVLPSNSLLIEHIIITIFSLILFFQMAHYPAQMNILKQDIFWFNTVVLVYFASDFLIWAFYNFYLRNKINNHFLVVFSYSINLLFYVVLGLSIWLNMNKRQSVEWKN